MSNPGNGTMAVISGKGDMDVIEYRKNIVREHHGGKSLSEKLIEAGPDVDAVINIILKELVDETDNLLGNEQISTEQGDLQSASVISFKRIEAFEKFLKSVQAKQENDRQRSENGLKVDSPETMIVFRYFMDKVKHVFEHMGLGDEVSDTFFRMLGDAMADWKKELKDEVFNLKAKTGK